MTARAVRLVVIGVCAAGVAGMIVSSVLDHNGAALTFGLITAAAVLCLMVATAVSGPAPERPAGGGPAPSDALAADVEARIARLADAGTDEAELRDLVRQAVRLGSRRASEGAAP